MILVTGANGQLGQLVIDELLQRVDASQIVAGVRSLDKGAELADKGIEVRCVDYDKPETMTTAFKDIEKLLLISSSEIGQRLPQQSNVINAAKAANVKLLAYTSILYADYSPLALAEEHRLTEARIAESGIPNVILRNGWYSENYLGNLPVALEHGVVLGAAKDGRISSAPRADYAAAAAEVLVRDNQAGKIYELAGDHSFTMNEFASMIEALSDKNVSYQNMSEIEFTNALIDVGLPDGLAQMLANADTGISKGGLFNDAGELSELIGRKTVNMKDTIKSAL